MSVQIKKKKVPTLRFPEFEEEWEEKRLGNVSKGIMYGMNSAATSFDGKNRYLRITDIDEASRMFAPNPLSSPEGEVEDKYKLKNGDIVFARTGASTGKCYLYRESDGNLYFAGFLIKFSIVKANPFFVYFQTFRNTYSRWVQVMSMRSGQPGINAEEYKSLKLYLPPLPEQQKIADFLTAIDTRIQQLSQKVDLLDKYRKGVMQQIFSQVIRFKDDQGNDYAEWEESKLGELTFKVGKKNKENINYPIYSINNKEGFLPQSDQFDGLDSNERGYDISLYKVIKTNTFAYNPARINVGSIGYSGTLNNVIISSLYVCFKTKEELDDQYLLSYLDTYEFNKAVLRNAEGGVRSYLFYDNFSNIKIPLPSLPEQQKITDFLGVIDQKIKLTRQQRDQMQEYKKGLLQQMFV